jgi:signal recognition particle GTPase
MITGQRSIFSKQKFNFIKDISDDEPWEEQKPETVEELESKLRKKNILLSSVKHLIPDFKEEQQPAQTQKTNTKKSFFNKLFGHLFIDIKGDENDGDKIKK